MVTGSRDWRDIDVIRNALFLRGTGPQMKLLHGCASGGDAIARAMSQPDEVLAFPTRGSRGTWHAVNYAKQRGYVEGETLSIYSEQSQVRRSKTLHEYPVEA